IALLLHADPKGLQRRRRDSNPRYPYEYAGFQNRCLKPLGHSSKSRKMLGGRSIAPENERVTRRLRSTRNEAFDVETVLAGRHLGLAEGALDGRRAGGIFVAIAL